MLHCIALGSIVYYALELVHNTLDNEVIIEELRAEVSLLEGRLEGVVKGSEGKEGGKGMGTGTGRRGWFW